MTSYDIIWYVGYTSESGPETSVKTFKLNSRVLPAWSSRSSVVALCSSIRSIMYQLVYSVNTLVTALSTLMSKSAKSPVIWCHMTSCDITLYMLNYWITFENNNTRLHHVAVFESIQAGQVRNSLTKNLHVSKRNQGLESLVHFIDLVVHHHSSSLCHGHIFQ